ncbi:MAG: AMP-dependent synthetase/ligase [Thermoplasmatota archaeon]
MPPATDSAPHTMGGLFRASVAAHHDRPAQRWHTPAGWQARSYAEFGAAVLRCQAGLEALGLRRGDRVALWSKNSPRWAEVDFANLSSGFVTVPIYDALTGEKGAFVTRDSGARVLFVQDGSVLERVLPVRALLGAVEVIVVLEDMPAPPAGVMNYEDFLRADPPSAAAVDSADLASIVYTSGTTGEPKGAMLTHENLASNALSAVGCVQIGPGDRFLSFLPLAHVLERTGGHFAPYIAGAEVAFAQSLDTLMEDMAAVKPTIMIAVPRLYEKMYARVHETVANSSWIRRALFRHAIGLGNLANVYRQANQPLPRRLARRLKRVDGLVLERIRQRVGGQLRYFVSGGAALGREIEAFFWAAGIPILQGYGLTETSPVTNVNRPGAIRFGSVGRALPGITIHIDETDWPQGQRPHREGEICVRGPNVMQGYWHNEAATRDVFDGQGYFHTGDIGYVDDDGFLFITDRKKEILVMSNGKKVPPQPIEGSLKLQPHVGQAMLVGEGRNYVAALLVPEWPALEAFALANGIPTQDRGRLVSDPRVVSLYEREVEAVNAKLSRYEQIKKFWILPEEWSVEGGELSVKMSLRRRIVSERHEKTIRSLYPPA